MYEQRQAKLQAILGLQISKFNVPPMPGVYCLFSSKLDVWWPNYTYFSLTQE